MVAYFNEVDEEEVTSFRDSVDAFPAGDYILNQLNNPFPERKLCA